jgi:hypothetical protein
MPQWVDLVYILLIVNDLRLESRWTTMNSCSSRKYYKHQSLWLCCVVSKKLLIFADLPADQHLRDKSWLLLVFRSYEMLGSSLRLSVAPLGTIAMFLYSSDVILGSKNFSRSAFGVTARLSLFASQASSSTKYGNKSAPQLPTFH